MSHFPVLESEVAEQLRAEDERRRRSIASFLDQYDHAQVRLLSIKMRSRDQFSYIFISVHYFIFIFNFNAHPDETMIKAINAAFSPKTVEKM